MQYQKMVKRILMVVIVIGLLLESCKVNVCASNKGSDYTDTVIQSFSWNEQGVYPVIPGDGIWEQLSFRQQLELITMPAEILENCTSEELAVWILEYPFLSDVLAFDTAEQAINYFVCTSNICREFFARKESMNLLLEEYKNLCVDYEMLCDEKVEKPWSDSGYVKELFLQTYFAYNYDKLSERERDELKSITKEKYLEKIGLCDDYSSALLFFDFIQAAQGYIPEDMIPDAIASSDLFEIAFVSDEEVAYDISPMASSGFANSGGTIVAQGATYYVGTYTLYGETVTCYKYKSGDFSDDEKKQIDAEYLSAHPSWRKVFSASKKYNCHSYAWIDASQSNVYWLDNPDAFANSSSFSYISNNGSAASGDRIIIRSATGSAVHSLLGTSNGTNSLSINTTSKLGRAGVYDASLVDMMIFYSGSYYEVYR